MRLQCQMQAICLLVLSLIGQPASVQAAPAAPPAATPSPAPSVRFTGYIQARETYREGVGLTGSINRARLTAFGTVATSVTWRIQGEFRTGSVGTGKASVSLQDAYVRYKTGDFGVQVGQCKTPFTREFITSLADVETADRSTVVDSIAPKRDIGIVADYAIGPTAMLMLGASSSDSRATGRPLVFHASPHSAFRRLRIF